MTVSDSKETKTPKQSTKESNIQEWPELQPARASLTPEQAFALEEVRLRAENAGKLLITRSKMLLAVVVVSLLLVVINGISVIPDLLRGQSGEVDFLLALNMLIQLSFVGYALRAKDPLMAAQVIRFVLILNGVVLFVGFSFLGVSALIALLILLLFAAYKHMEQIARID